MKTYLRSIPARQKFGIAVFLVLGVVLIGGSAPMLVDWTNGTLTRAKITDCTVSGRPTYAEDCNGTWVARNGRVVYGNVFGADDSMVGKTIEVRASGDSAHVTSLATPLLLLGLGIVCCLLALFPLTKRGRRNMARVQARRAQVRQAQRRQVGHG